MLENISIRRLEEKDWRELRYIRLKAVRSEPSLFLKSYEEEAAVSEDEWKSRLSSESGAIFGLFDSGRIIGITGSFRFRESPEDTAIFGMSYLEPEYRGKGLSKMLYVPRLAWVRAQEGIRRVIISHREGNEASRGSILKWGFRPYEKEVTTFGDGSKAKEHKYELRFT